MRIIVSYRETTAPFLTTQKNSNWGFFPGKIYYQRSVLSQWPHLYGRTNIQLPSICSSFYLPVNDPPALESTRTLPHSLAKNGIHTSLYLSISEPLMYMGVPVHTKLNLIFLLLIYLINSQTSQKNLEEQRKIFFVLNRI